MGFPFNEQDALCPFGRMLNEINLCMIKQGNSYYLSCWKKQGSIPTSPQHLHTLLFWQGGRQQSRQWVEGTLSQP